MSDAEPTAAEQAADYLIEKLQQMVDEATRTAETQDAAAEGTSNYTRQLKYEKSAAFHRALAEQAQCQAERLRAERADVSSADDADGPIQDFFGLTYSSYQVVPRVLAQSMPHEWQARFVACMEEMQSSFGYLGDVSYDVRTAEEVYANELTEAQQRAAGVTCEWDEGRDEDVYYDRDANEISGQDRVMVPVPDPLPSYSRGRTRVPRADQLLTAHSCSNCEGVDPASCPFNTSRES